MKEYGLLGLKDREDESNISKLTFIKCHRGKYIEMAESTYNNNGESLGEIGII